MDRYPLRKKRQAASSPPESNRRPPLPNSQPQPNLGSDSNTAFPDGLKVLYEDPDDAVVDICFVHGLTGDRMSTWTAAGQSRPWPQTLLPLILKKTRILTYGYDAYVVRKIASTNRLIDHATNLMLDLTLNRARHDASSRPLIFVAHSLGGLVCKEAILLSRNNADASRRGIFECTKGIAFMGTPHRGAWMADWAKIPLSALGLTKSINTKLLDVLQRDNQLLERIQVHFAGMIRELEKEGDRCIEIACFYEELPLPFFGPVVSKESAMFEGHDSFSIHANHRDMARFASTEENGFQRLSLTLDDWVKQVATNLSEMEIMTETCQKCLKSLAFSQMNDRFYGIHRATKGTCEWLLRHETYLKWAAGDQSLLWIKGKPGSGKSTLVKYALEDRRTKDSAFVLSFFFHGRGDDLQKTPLGLFRSLLHQILSQAPSAMLDLVDSFERKHTGMGEPDENWKWHEDELEYFLQLSLPRVLRSHSVWIFVDALDECGKENAIRLVHTFKSLLKSLPAASTGLKPFHLCFACRHYPILDLDVALEIYPENENKHDISTFVNYQLSAFRERTFTEVPALITRRAAGVFMWARFVVDRVLDLERDGASLGNITAVVYSLPPELDELYERLVKTMKPASLKLIQWICFAVHPLSLDELRWAMLIDADHPHQSLQEYRSDDDYVPDNPKMKRQVQTLSCGLAEVVTRAQRVQFIHQSVKDFFVEKGLQALDRRPVSACEAIGRAHFRLSRICIRYLAMKEIGHLVGDLDNDPSIGSDTGTDSDDVISVRCDHDRVDDVYNSLNRIGKKGPTKAFPFLAYATIWWTTHLKQSDVYNIPQGDLLELFSWPSNVLVDRWRRVYEEIHGRHVYCPRKGVHLAHILADYGMIGPLRTILQRAGENGSDIDLEDHSGRAPLRYAARAGHEAAVQLLLDGGANIESTDKRGKTPLSSTAGRGHEAVVRLLLKKGANIHTIDKGGRTPLSRAAEGGYEAIGELLLDNGVSIESVDQQGLTPLVWAIRAGKKAAVRLLLNRGANVHSVGKDGRTPLFWAAITGHTAIVQLLLDKGANIESTDENGQTALSLAAALHRVKTVRLLLDSGANVESLDHQGRTPLSYGAEIGCDATAQLLLENGANVESVDHHGRTPLSYAAEGPTLPTAFADRGGYDTTVQLLLDYGADVKSIDRRGWTPLSWASVRRHENVVQLLLDNGADTYSVDDECRTPLSNACEILHNEAVGQLLLDSGADVNQADRQDRTPLS